MNKINDNLYTFEGQQDIVSPQLVYYPAIIRENIRKMIDIAGGAARLWRHIKTHKSVPWFEKAHQIKPDDVDTLEFLKSICFRLRDEAGIMEKYNTYNALYKQVKGIE